MSLHVPWARWRPRLFECLPGYSRRSFLADFIAGITVGLVAIPLAMAFGIASGVTPQAGLYTAVLGGFIVSALGGSKIQIGGPTGAFVVIVAGIIAKNGLPGLLMVTMMAGAILLVLGFTGLGNAVKFIPRPIVIGFTNGIALLIALTQVKDFFGLKADKVPSEFFARVRVLGAHFATLDPATVALAAISLAIILLVPKFFPRVPGSIVALVLATAAVMTFHLPVATIGTSFGGIPSGLPSVHVPMFRPDLILPLLPSAMTVAILAAVESLLSAVVADSMIGDRHNSNAELVAQGVANLLTPLVGGIPVTGAIARTATNFRSGGRSPVAGIVHALTLLAILLVFAPLAKFVPLATLAAVLFVVSYNMSEWREIGSVFRAELADISVWLVTFVLTVVADLTVAVEVGMSLAALLYIYRVAQTTTVSKVTPEYIREGQPHILQDKEFPPYVSVLRIHGPFLFGATDQLTEYTTGLSGLAPIVIVRLRNMTAIDATGLHALEVFSNRLMRTGRSLILCGACNQPARIMRQPDFIEHIGAKNIVSHVEAALARAREIQSGFAGLGSQVASELQQVSM